MIAMMVAFGAGCLFALGLLVSGMTDPARVLGFLDVRHWDPTLAFVMAGALALHAPLARLVRARRATHDPTATRIDARLVLGAALFGIGWGASGYCPGPALVSFSSSSGALVFTAALLVGIALSRRPFGRRREGPRG